MSAVQPRTISLKGGQPWRSREQASSAGLPAEFGNYPWQFVHYAMGWMYDDELGFIPSLSRIEARPGCNGVDLSLSTARANAGAAKKGGRIIDPTDRRLGQWMDYVVWYDVAGGRKHFCFTGTEFALLPGGQARAIDNSVNVRKFCAHLRDVGVVDAMSGVIYNVLLDMETTKLTRLRRRAVKSDGMADLVKAQDARVSAMRKAWEAMGEAPITEPALAGDAPAPRLTPKSATKIIKAAEAPHAG